MSEKTVVFTEHGGTYEIQNNGIPEFALVGILECVLFDLKTDRREKSVGKKENTITRAKSQTDEITEKQKESTTEPDGESNKEPKKEQDDKPDENPSEKLKPEVVLLSTDPNLQTRIANAVKAIKALGGEVDEKIDRPGATDNELKTELGELTEQYKRLKSSKSVKK